MPLQIVRNDITKMRVDAIVNAANGSLLGGGGVDGAIHRAAGPGLLAECRTLHGCRTGEAKITRGYDLPAKYVIHTVGPVWNGGGYGERELLASCYRRSLALAREHGCRSVAFPLISAGAYGYPREQALRIATDVIRDELLRDEADMLVYIVVFDRAGFHLSGKLYAGIAQYIDDQYAQAREDRRDRRLVECAAADPAAPYGQRAVCASSSLEQALGRLEESFSQMLLRKIDERGMTDPECYKRANLDRKLFSKIRSDAHYKPGKRTALALALALELSLEETEELLRKAGFALSHSNKFDIIVEYCIRNGIYDVHTVNELLFDFDQALLGA